MAIISTCCAGISVFDNKIVRNRVNIYIIT